MKDLFLNLFDMLIRTLILSLMGLTTLLPSIAMGGNLVPKEIRNSIGMKFILIPSGEFMMGSDEAVATLAKAYPHYDITRLQALSDEAPVHRVRITRSFYLGQHEVTVGQFRQFVEESGYIPESEADGTGGYGYNPDYDPANSERGDAFEGRDPKYSWKNPGFRQGDDHPVVNVTWNDAVALSQWLSVKEGKAYRLPTEAEWEYACRAGTRTRYYSGDDPQILLEVANTFAADTKAGRSDWTIYATAGHDGFEFTAPVGSFTPNPWSLYDMHGNVWEWVADWYGDNYYAASPIENPPGPDRGEVRVRRGGSWHTWSFYVRSSFRNWNKPDTRYTLVGIRLLREVDAEKQ